MRPLTASSLSRRDTRRAPQRCAEGTSSWPLKPVREQLERRPGATDACGAPLEGAKGVRQAPAALGVHIGVGAVVWAPEVSRVFVGASRGTKPRGGARPPSFSRAFFHKFQCRSTGTSCRPLVWVAHECGESESCRTRGARGCSLAHLACLRMVCVPDSASLEGADLVLAALVVAVDGEAAVGGPALLVPHRVPQVCV